MKKILVAIAMSVAAAFSIPALASNDIPLEDKKVIEIGLGAGNEGFTYDRAMKRVASHVNGLYRSDSRKDRRSKYVYDAFVENYNGSSKIIEAFENKEIDAGVAQIEAFILSNPTREFTLVPGPTEYTWWLYNREHDRDDFGDIKSDESIVVVKDSGTMLTIENWAKSDSGYKKFTKDGKNVVYARNPNEGLRIAANGETMNHDNKIVGMLIVAGSLSNDVLKYADKLAIGEAVDNQFNNFEYRNKPVYKFVDIKLSGTRLHSLIGDHKEVEVIELKSYGFIATDLSDSKVTSELVDIVADKLYSAK